jgi:sugar/nucleoside kinase (ribokinase family)
MSHVDGTAYLYGMTLMTTSHRLADGFPQPDGYAEIVESHRLPGGETGTCAVVLGGLGMAVRVDGNHLGRTTYPDLVAYFASTSVSLDLMTYEPDFEGLEDIVFIDRNTRTTFGTFAAFYADRSVRRWNPAHEAAISSAAVVGLDPFFFDDSEDVAALCDRHGVRFATVDCRADSSIHRRAAVDVLSAEFLRGAYPDRDPESLFTEYTAASRGLVIFTFGDDELWFGRRGGAVQRFRPYRVEVESTLGAGDAFKAGVVYALWRGMDDATLVRFASATAAAACTSYPIADNPPDLARISAVAGESFLG